MFRLEMIDGRMFVRLDGQVTFEHAEELRTGIEKQLGGSDFECLVVDLSKVEFLDSSGIGLLVALNSRVYGGGSRFALLAPTPRVRKTLELVKLLDFFLVARDEVELDVLLAQDS